MLIVMLFTINSAPPSLINRKNIFMNEQKTTDTRYAGLFRRLFAISYDGFLLVAILFVVSAIATAMNGGKAVERGDTLYPVLVLLIFFLSVLIKIVPLGVLFLRFKCCL